MKYRGGRTHGFTIVELLIVIVVIAILAAITVVAYNGITQRTENTKTVTAVKEWAKILLAYKADTGNFPDFNTSDARGSYEKYPCLGTGYPDQKCMSLNNNVVIVVGVAYESDAFDAKIKRIVNGFPTPSMQVVTFNNEPHRGVFASLGDNGSTASIGYVLKGGSTRCPDFGLGKSTEGARSSDGVYCYLGNL